MSAVSKAKRVALVTGGNKGIGYAICKALASHDLIVLLGARDMEKGKQAVSTLEKEGKNVHPIQLDVSNKESIQQAAQTVKEKYGGLDILINNAGMAFKGDAFDGNVVRTTFKTNFYGLMDVCDAFFPLIHPHGRVVHLASSTGKNAFNNMKKEWRDKFMNDNLTRKELIDLMETFAADVERGDYAQRGWPKSAYGMSKAGVMALTRIQAREIKPEQFIINAVDPGWVKTDMAGDRAPLTPDQGAETPVYAALLPDSHDTPHGAFLKDQKIQAFHD